MNQSPELKWWISHQSWSDESVTRAEVMDQLPELKWWTSHQNWSDEPVTRAEVMNKSPELKWWISRQSWSDEPVARAEVMNQSPELKWWTSHQSWSDESVARAEVMNQSQELKWWISHQSWSDETVTRAEVMDQSPELKWWISHQSWSDETVTRAEVMDQSPELKWWNSRQSPAMSWSSHKQWQLPASTQDSIVALGKAYMHCIRHLAVLAQNTPDIGVGSLRSSPTSEDETSITSLHNPPSSLFLKLLSISDLPNWRPTIKGWCVSVTVSTSAFLACHQCYSAGLSLAWGLNLRALVLVREPWGPTVHPPTPSPNQEPSTMVPKCTFGCPEHSLTCSPDSHWDALEL